MSKDGRIKTTYDRRETLYESFVHVRPKDSAKSFFIIYQSNYFLGKALQKLRRSKRLTLISHNYKKY